MATATKHHFQKTLSSAEDEPKISTETYAGLGTSLEGNTIPTDITITPHIKIINTSNNRVLFPENIDLTGFEIHGVAAGDAPPYVVQIEVTTFDGGVATAVGVEPNKFIARMSRDKRLDAFMAKNREHLFEEFLYELIFQAQIDVLKDTKCRLKEDKITLAKDARAVKLPNDFLILNDARYKQSGDDALAEGIEIEIRDEKEFV